MTHAPEDAPFKNAQVKPTAYAKCMVAAANGKTKPTSLPCLALRCIPAMIRVKA